jgi:hypothetical protein
MSGGLSAEVKLRGIRNPVIGPPLNPVIDAVMV